MATRKSSRGFYAAILGLPLVLLAFGTQNYFVAGIAMLLIALAFTVALGFLFVRERRRSAGMACMVLFISQIVNIASLQRLEPPEVRAEIAARNAREASERKAEEEKAAKAEQFEKELAAATELLRVKKYGKFAGEYRGGMFRVYGLKGSTDDDRWEVTGTVLNTSGRRLAYAQVDVVFLDDNDTRHGQAFANVSDLRDGEAWKFSAVCYARGANWYRVDDVWGK